ncbi:hypothetical protein [Ruegeria atlantica]|uniref:hypothetical protein n=1 Tax=Ruegeria atlantica TaxID=81569 RepID=UPI002494EAAC|nr:hypothetical protein [Ruegeria atlantica]
MSASNRSHLKLVFEKETRADNPLPGCQRVPVWWVPDGGVQHNGTTVGVKWRCARCGVEGKGIFGPERALTGTSVEAERVFMNDPATRARCVYMINPVGS